MPTASFKAAILAGRIEPGMSFNQRVWAVCARVPLGRVATYGQIAEALGSPAAARAVGGALHANPLAPGVPCHRVVGCDGSLTGYAGGLAKKLALLRAEGVVFKGDKADLSLCKIDALAQAAPRKT